MLLTAEFLTAESAVAAVSLLRAGGIPESDMELFSDRPLPSGVLTRRSRISLAVAAGAAINGVLATAFVFFTQRNYRLVTGGMPLVSGWSTGVVSFELTMAGAVAGVVLAFLWEAGLGFRRHAAAPPKLKEGSVFLRIACREDTAAAAAQRLEKAGAAEVVKQ